MVAVMPTSPAELLKRGCGSVSIGLDATLPPRNNQRLGVLTYHRTAPTGTVDRHDDLNVAPEVFRSQLAGLLRAGFNFVSIDDVVEWQQGKRTLPRRAVHVTFDDGYACTALYAAPILSELDLPATVFVNTAFTGDPGPFPFDPNRDAYPPDVPPAHYRPMSREELRSVIDDSTITIGAHSHSHENFVAHPERFDEDVQLNLKILREEYGLHTIPFAFPYGVVRLGYAGGALSRKVSDHGVSCAFSTEPDLIDLHDDLFCLSRMSAYPWDTPRSLQAKLNGWFSWAGKLQAFVSRS
jgi:peptidoglycan/xylan/chitin deacetylase (PgdA/CDA1 family)